MYTRENETASVLYSVQRETSDGSLEVVTIKIPYQDKATLHVLVDDIQITSEAQQTTPYTWVWDGQKVRISPAVANGSEVLIRRVSTADQMKNIFNGQAQFTDQAMDENFKQLLWLAQEYGEGSGLRDVFSNINMHGYKITNTGWATDPDDVVTYGQYLQDAQGARQAAQQAQQALQDAQDILSRAQTVTDQLQQTNQDIQSTWEQTQTDMAEAVQSTQQTAQQAQDTLRALQEQIQQSINSATGDIGSAIDTGKAQIDSAVEQAKSSVSSTVSSAVSTITSTKDQAVQAINQGVQDAQQSIQLAKDWAVKMDGLVNNQEYSSKYYANQAKADADRAQDWAIKMDGTVDGSQYSAKYYAQQAKATADSVDMGTAQIVAAKADALQSVQEARSAAVTSVQGQGTAQVSRVQQQASTSISAVSAEGTRQVGLVTSQGGTQVQAVKDQGTAQIALINQKLSTIEDSVTEAQTYAQTASTQAGIAQGHANTAQTAATSAQSAKTAAQAAKTSAQTAANTATTAKNAAQAAKTSAESAKDSAVSAQTAAQSAADRAQEAAQNAAAGQIQSDWNQTDTSAKDYIKNKPDLSGYALKSDISSIYKPKGSVDTYGQLPSDAAIGDVYNVATDDRNNGIKAGDNVVWTGSYWDNLSGFVDLSPYLTSETASRLYLRQDTASTTYATKTALADKLDVSTYTTDKVTFATKTQLGNKLDTSTYNSDKENFATKSQIPDTSTLATKSEVTSGLANKVDTSTYTSDKTTFALKTQIPDTSGLATKTQLSDYATTTALTQGLAGKLDTTGKAASATVADSANAVDWDNVSGKPTIPDTSTLVAKSGDRGTLAGYQTIDDISDSPNVDANSGDALYVDGSNGIAILDGTANTSWTKIIDISHAYRQPLTCGNAWHWSTDSAPQLKAGFLVMHWHGTAGVLNFIPLGAIAS